MEDNNADKSFNGKYTWVIDDNNYSNKNIYIKINHTPKANGISPTVAILIGVSVVLLIGLVYLYLLIIVLKKIIKYKKMCYNMKLNG